MLSWQSKVQVSRTAMGRRSQNNRDVLSNVKEAKHITREIKRMGIVNVAAPDACSRCDSFCDVHIGYDILIWCNDKAFLQ